MAISPLSNEEKEVIFKTILSQFKDISTKYHELSFISKLSCLSSLIKNNFESNRLSFVGFYLVTTVSNNEKVLQIGPYNSHVVAVPQIEYGKGVCGTAWKLEKTCIEKDVNECNNYIACDSKVKSEIVVPLFDQSQTIVGVLDIDSELIGNFDEIDLKYYEILMGLVFS